MRKTKDTDRIFKFSSLTLGTKVTILYAALFSIMLISISVFIMINTSVYYRISSEQEIQELMEKVVKHIENGGSTEQEAIDEIIGNRLLKVEVQEIQKIKEARAALDSPPNAGPAQNERPNEGETSPQQPPSRPNSDDKKKDFRTQPEIEMIDGLRFMYHSNIAKYGDKTYMVEVLRPYYQESKTLRSIFLVFIVVNIFGIGLAFLIGRFISKQMLKPISRITQTANSISINDLSQRLTIPEPDDEIRKLSITFNDMIDGLQESVEKQKQFVSDASHELRTPISVIQGYINLIDRWGKTDSDILQESIDSIKYETNHMGQLIEKLLFLARSDNNAPLNMKNISMNSIIDEIKRESEISESVNKSEFHFSQEENIEVYGDYDLIKKLIWIFIENAVKYSDKERKCVIDVSLYKDNGKVYVKIKDNGIGIKKEELSHIFDRFYRSDQSRGETQGTGLGLSIAKRIAERHGGSIYAESEFGKGSVFIIELQGNTAQL